MIHMKGTHCRSSRLGSALNVCPIPPPSEVTRPFLSTRIEKTCQTFTDRVSMVRPHTFLEIAASTGQGQIVRCCRTAKRFWENVFDMQRTTSNQLWTLAVFTPMLRPLNNSFA